MKNIAKEHSWNSIIDEINSIPTETVSQRLGLTLIRTGNSLQGNCPSEHPSQSGRCFSINNDKNYFHCFHCNKGGDNIRLAEITRKTDFKGSIKWFIDEFQLNTNIDFENIEDRELDNEKQIEISMLYESLVEYGKRLLFKDQGKEVLEYLVKDRGYNIEKLKQTEWFYFPSVKECKELLYRQFPGARLDELKLCGYFGDNFRLALPYRNKKGIITGLLKRAESSKGKELTSFDGKEHLGVRWDSTKNLDKSDLFNLHNCKRMETVIVLEGYPDAAYLPTLGIINVTATGQGLLSKNHIEGLKKFNIKNVIISFDNDEVGPVNTEKAVRLILDESELKVFVLEPKLLLPHKDPDEYVKANGKDAYIKLVEFAEVGEIWLTKTIIAKNDISKPLNRKQTLDRLFDIAASIDDPLTINEFIKETTCAFGLKEIEIKNGIKQRKAKTAISRYQQLRNNEIEKSQRYFPFIEKSTSQYAYYDREKDNLYMGLSKDILEKILISDQQLIPDILSVLTVVFDVTKDKRIDLDREEFNLFVPTKYMLLHKNNELIDPRRNFPSIYLLLTNLFPKYIERKLYINWLAGILQTREKQLTAWILKGKQGAGKGLMLDHILKPLFGRNQVIKVEDQELRSEFNGWLKNVMFIGFNEVAHDNETRNSINSKVKAIVTDNDILINEKNIKTYPIKNHVNCLFFSNSSIPLFIEEGDRRFNVVITGNNLRRHDWFLRDPEYFIRNLGLEVPMFAQFLMNWNYDPMKAKTVINNEDKKAMVSAAMNRFEEFALHLKSKDIDWLQENITQDDRTFYPDLTFTDIDDINIENRISKRSALNLFNNLYMTQKINGINLSKQLKLYGIYPLRSKAGTTNRIQYYTWNIP